MDDLRIDDRDVRVLCDIRNTVGDLPMMIIGAGARRLLFDLPRKLTHARTTTDWDIAVQLDHWQGFYKFYARACAQGGFSPTESPHRLIHQTMKIFVDIVPFGGIAEDNVIAWPNTEMSMSVAGFAEAMRFARNTLITAGVEIKVITPEMLAVLKCFAFADRGNKTSRDLQDLLLLAEYYSQESVEGRLFEAPFDTLIQSDAFDYHFGGALLLGHDMAANCEKQALDKLLPILDRLCIRDSDLLYSLASTPGQHDLTETKRSLYFNLFYWLATGAHSVGDSAK
jgi:predicted nucleotidyltransferase